MHFGLGSHAQQEQGLTLKQVSVFKEAENEI